MLTKYRFNLIINNFEKYNLIIEFIYDSTNVVQETFNFPKFLSCYTYINIFLNI